MPFSHNLCSPARKLHTHEPGYPECDERRLGLIVRICQPRTALDLIGTDGSLSIINGQVIDFSSQ